MTNTIALVIPCRNEYARLRPDAFFARPFRSRWLFDVELLRRVTTDELERHVREIPLRSWRDVPGSKMRLKDVVRSLVDLLRIVHEGREHRGVGVRFAGGLGDKSRPRMLASTRALLYNTQCKGD